MRRLASLLMACMVVFAVLDTTSGCSLRQTKTVELPPATSTTRVIVRRQALDWTVAWSFYAASYVRLTYQTCPGQHLLGRPEVQQTTQTVSITLWANPKDCPNPITKEITVPLGQPLGHRALTNPSLLQ